MTSFGKLGGRGNNLPPIAERRELGINAQIGLSAENAAGFVMNFDYIRVYRLAD